MIKIETQQPLITVRNQNRLKNTNSCNQNQNNDRMNNQLSSRESSYMHTLTDDITDKMPVGFLLYIESYVSVTKNLGVRYQLANGTRAKVVGWQFPEGTIFKQTLYKGIMVTEPFKAGTNNFIQENLETIQFALIHLCTKNKCD